MTEHEFEPKKYLCRYCEKPIYGLVALKFVIGVEPPATIHMVCYERLKEIEGMYINDNFTETKV